jgi:hypothetical protein
MFDPLGGLLDALFGWFINSWTLSGSEATKKAIEALVASPWPDLGANWFQRLWGSVFGLSIIVGLLSVIVHSMIFMFRYRHAGFAGVIANFFKLLLNGTFLLVVLFMVMGLVDFLVKALVAIFEGLSTQAQWYDPLIMVNNANMVDIWGSLGLSFIGVWAGQTLYAAALLNAFMIYMFALWYLLGSAFGAGKLAQWVRSAFGAALLSLLFAKAVQIFWLGSVGVALDLGQILAGMPPAAVGWVVVISTLFALAIPVVMFIFLFIAMLRVERKLDVKLMIEQQAKNRSLTTTSSELAERRARGIDNLGEGVRNTAGAAAKAVAIAGTTLAITKASAAVLSRLSGAAPTPQTKAIAAASWVVSAGSGWLEGKTRQYINNRIGRPGASRSGHPGR